MLIYLNNALYSSSILSLKSWYNFTISVDQFDNTLKVLMGSTNLRSIALSQSFPLLSSTSMTFSAGIVEGNGTINIDAFRLKDSPVAYITPPIESPQFSQKSVTISGDFFRGSLSIYLGYPTGRIDRILPDIMSYDLNSTKGFEEALSLPAGAPAGTYTLTVSDTTGTVVYHMGAWNISSTNIRRKEKLRIQAGGLLPGGSFTVAINSSTVITLTKTFTVPTNTSGKVTADLEIPVNHPLGTFSIRLLSVGTMDSSFRSISTSYYPLTIQACRLNVTTNMNATLRRATDYEIRAYLKYPDGADVPATSSVTFKLTRGAVVRAQSLMTWDSRGFWKYLLSLSMNEPIGTYLASIEGVDPYSNQGSWNSTIQIVTAQLVVTLSLPKANFTRKETINATVFAKYPNGISMEEGNIKVYLRKLPLTLPPISLTHISDEMWEGSYLIPESLNIGSWTITAEATDLNDNQGTSNEIVINITRATLRHLLGALPSTIERASRLWVTSSVLYPDGTAVHRGTCQVTLAQPGQVPLIFPLEYNETEGGWAGLIELPRNLPLGDYTMTFDAKDEYGNAGISVHSLEVKVARLKLNLTVGRVDVQSIYEEQTITLKVTYPDLSEMVDGLVNITISSGSFQKVLDVYYRPGVGWTASHRPGVTDPAGSYSISVQAHDDYDNSGSASGSFTVSHLFFYATIGAVVAIAVVVVIWILRTRLRKEAPAPNPYVKYY